MRYYLSHYKHKTQTCEKLIVKNINTKPTQLASPTQKENVYH